MPPQGTSGVYSGVRAWNARDAAAITVAIGLIVTRVWIWGAPDAGLVIFGGLFAALGFLVRGLSLSGALCGFAIAFTFWGSNQARLNFNSLVLLFVLTWAATRLSSRKGQHRDGVQVFANLGIAGIAALLNAGGDFFVWSFFYKIEPYAEICIFAVLAEVAADTVSSEIGTAFGGAPISVVKLRRTPVGENGAISFIGTLAGVAAAAMICGFAVLPLSRYAEVIPLSISGIALVAAVLGMFFDSLLGATLENRRWLNNDAVNFLSTCFAAAVACGLLWLERHR